MFKPILANSAPATTVLPLMETLMPNKSRAWPSDAMSLAVWVMLAQPELGSTNT